jgi:fructose-1-phosphate kinase PfkB-like protein
VTVQPCTRLCVTVLDRDAQTATELVEESSPVESDAWPALLSKLATQLEQATLLVLSGTLTPGAPQDSYYKCVKLASEKGVPTIIDAQGGPLIECLRAGPMIAKPNRLELGATLGLPVNTERTLQ